MIIGHQIQRELLRKTAEAGKVSHAYLFAGQEKLGKKKVVLEWISVLFGDNLKNNRHPDLTIIEPEGKEIQIGQIRDLIWKLSLKPYSSSIKAAIIDQAHLMNKEAQSAFLKTLEEPRGDAVLILISEYPQYLLSTILSRVKTIKFYPVKEEEIKGYLQKKSFSEKDAKEISRFSMGRPGAAIDFISDSSRLKEFRQKIKKISQISDANIASRFQYAKALSENPLSLKELLDVWLLYFRDVLLEAAVRGAKTGYFGGKQYSFSKLRNIIKQIQTARFLIATTNVNPKLTLELLMLQF